VATPLVRRPPVVRPVHHRPTVVLHQVATPPAHHYPTVAPHQVARPRAHHHPTVAPHLVARPPARHLTVVHHPVAMPLGETRVLPVAMPLGESRVMPTALHQAWAPVAGPSAAHVPLIKSKVHTVD
jgi:hypothetical protein